MAVLLSFLDTYVWVCIYKHKFVCVCINNPLQILASMQTYVNALRESGGPGLSAGSIPWLTQAWGAGLGAWALEGFKGVTHLVADIPLPMQLPGCMVTHCSVGLAFYGTLHQIMPSTTNGFSFSFLAVTVIDVTSIFLLYCCSEN